jgi:hypothetical protein
MTLQPIKPLKRSFFATDQTIKINLLFSSDAKKEGAHYDILLHQKRCNLELFYATERPGHMNACI